MNPGSSPTKRRAALAALDANAMTTSTPTTGKHADLASTSSSPLKPLSAANRRTSGLLSSAPVLAPPRAPSGSSPGAPSVGMKRSSGIMVLQDAETAAEDIQQQQQQVPKKNKLEHAQEAPPSTQSSRTHSPDASSVFDAEGQEDATWVTTATDDVGVMVPVVVAARPPPPRVVLTREQAREKIEILRLRLGLASYKLRTGQVSVPLADLQARPLPPPPAASTVEHTPDNSQGGGSSAQDSSQEQDEDVEVVAATPPPAAMADMASR
ncbi:cyclin-dependent kinase [Akanthomyces lecanii RCEF 1005]|uniref:Cyclin-dependent kinase n=1 Tax=Akanthomyces lecanii RCEF 1005 TaxID=1081108 RepID=A0A162KW21_CORDF|nr:cyclin-dependent kinase [Akanthomyces lecanii RCEF 1005]